jgi:hypothetical protein
MLVGFARHGSPLAQHWKIENMNQTLIESLLVERAGYVNRKLADRVKQVDASLRELGYEHKYLTTIETATAEPVVEVAAKPATRKRASN